MGYPSVKEEVSEENALKALADRACEVTVELAKDNDEDWCPEGIIDFLNDIFPTWLHDRIRDKVKELGTNKFIVTIQFTTADTIDCFDEYNGENALAEFGFEDFNEIDVSITEVED